MPSDKGQPKCDLRTVFDAPRGLEGRIERDRNTETVAWQLRGGYPNHAAMAKKEILDQKLTAAWQRMKA